MNYKKRNVEPGTGKALDYRTSSANEGEWAEFLCPHSNTWQPSLLWRNGDLPRNPDQFEMVGVDQ